MNNIRTETTREISNERGRHVRKESASNNIKGKQLQLDIAAAEAIYQEE